MLSSNYLERLLVQILLLARDKVRSHDSGLHTSGDLPGEDTAESVEPALVRVGHHLGDVHHDGGVRVADLDAHTGEIVMRSLVLKLGSEGRKNVKITSLLTILGFFSNLPTLK